MRQLSAPQQGNARQLAEEICQSLHQEQGVLLDADGQAWALSEHQELNDIFIRRGDTYIVGPHGEIVPFVTKAMADGAIPIEHNRLMHFDAHFDNRRKSPDGRGFTFDSHASTIRMLYYLDALSGGNMKATFANLINSMLGDIETFLATLGSFNDTFAAFLREETRLFGNVIGPMHPSQYIEKFPKEDVVGPSIAAVISEIRPTIYSFDADVVGSKREISKNVSPQVRKIVMIRTMRDIFEGMQAELRIRREPPPIEGAVYSISIDKNWCLYRVSFLQVYIEKFYLELVRINTSRRVGEIIHR